ncbi:hypothetical protein BH10PSE19_BH10PSE19_09090 [soil metagenome]
MPRFTADPLSPAYVSRSSSGTGEASSSSTGRGTGSAGRQEPVPVEASTDSSTTEASARGRDIFKFIWAQKGRGLTALVAYMTMSGSSWASLWHKIAHGIAWLPGLGNLTTWVTGVSSADFTAVTTTALTAVAQNKTAETSWLLAMKEFGNATAAANINATDVTAVSAFMSTYMSSPPGQVLSVAAIDAASASAASAAAVVAAETVTAGSVAATIGTGIIGIGVGIAALAVAYGMLNKGVQYCKSRRNNTLDPASTSSISSMSGATSGSSVASGAGVASSSVVPSDPARQDALRALVARNRTTVR